MPVEYVFAALSVVYVVLGTVRLVNAGHGRTGVLQGRVRLLLGAIFAIAATWLFWQPRP